MYQTLEVVSNPVDLWIEFCVGGSLWRMVASVLTTSFLRTVLNFPLSPLIFFLQCILL